MITTCITKPDRARRLAASAGFSLLEIFVTVTIIAAIATVAISMEGSRMHQTIGTNKLQSDVALLNQMVNLYLADGGSLDGISSEQAVLDKLKRARPSAEAKQQVGISTGRFVDVRLSAHTGTGPLLPGQSYRAVWVSTATSKRFNLDSSGAPGVDDFYLNSNLSDTNYPLDTRTTSSKQFNNNNGWVWGNTAGDTSPSYVSPSLMQVNPVTPGFSPTTPVGGGSGGSSGSGSGSGGSGSGGAGSTPPAQLPSPLMTPGGGSFAYADFPTTVTIATPSAPSGQYTTQYRVNGGSWQPYTAAVPVTSGSLIEAQNLATGPTVTDSGVSGQSYYRLVSGFDGTESGSWVSPTGGSNLVTNTTPGDPTTTFAHGNTRLDLGNGQFIDAGVQNTLSFTKNDFNGVLPNTPFTLGTMVMLNGTTFNNSEANSVTLHLSLNFSNPASTAGVDVKLNLISTPNSSDRLASADIVQLSNPNAGVAVNVDGVSYNLQLQWQSLDPGAGVVQGDQFLIFEGSSATAQLIGTLVSNH